jgi:glutamate synthase (NADPH) large chain
MVGRTDLARTPARHQPLESRGLDFSPCSISPRQDPRWAATARPLRTTAWTNPSTWTTLLPLCTPAIENGTPVQAELPIRNVHRVVGTITGSELTRRHGAAGLPDDTIRIRFKGSAGQSFGAFLPHGMTFTLEGDANDYVGKGLSGGKIIVHPPAGSTFLPEENIIIGNVAFYGATAARPSSAAWPVNGSASATAASTPSSKPSATTAANT